MTSSKNSKADGQITVYYDGACPLCRREIAVYRAMKGADEITWHDVSNDASEQVAPDLDRCSAMRRFHVRRSDGSLVSGATAFSELWRALPNLTWAGWIAGLPGIRHGAEIFYRAFLVIRPYVQRITPR